MHPQNRDVAQLVAHYVRDVGVGRSSRLIPTFETLQHVRVVAQAATFFVEIVVDFRKEETFPYLPINQLVIQALILLRGKSRFTRHKLGVYPE